MFLNYSSEFFFEPYTDEFYSVQKCSCWQKHNAANGDAESTKVFNVLIVGV